VVSGSGTSTLTITGTVDQINAFLGATSTSTLSYIDNTDTPVASTTLTLSVSDNGFTGSGEPLTGSASSTITIAAVDDAPVLTVAATASYTQNDPAVTLSSAATVSDVDNQFLQSATVSISSGFLAGDVLSADVTGTSITAIYDEATGVLTLTGNDTLAHYQQVLDSVTYESTSSNPTNSGSDPSRTISWVVNDGTLDSATQTTTLNIIADVVTIPAGTTSTLNGGTLQASFIDVEGTLIGFGTITADVIENNGTITAKSSHTLLIEISGSITGTGVLELTNKTTLTLEGPVGSGQTVLFDIGEGATGTLVLADASEFYAQISGFSDNDKIDIANIDFNTAHADGTYDSSTNITTLVITDGQHTYTLKLVGDYTGSTWTFSDDGSGGATMVDPPALTTTSDPSTATTDASITTADASTTTTATVTPVSETSALTETETTSSRRRVASAADDEAIMVALSTAVAMAISAAVSDGDGGEISNLTISGDGAVADVTDSVAGSESSTANSDGAAEPNRTSHRMAGTITDNETVEVVNGKLEIAGAVSETGVFKIDAEAALQLDGSDAANTLVITDGTYTDTIDLPGNHTINTARNFSDDSRDGRGGKVPHETPVSVTGEETSVQSISAGNGFIVSSPLTEMLSGNGDHSARLFMTSFDHHASANPEINYIAKNLPQHPADNSLHMPAQLADNGSPTVTDGAHPGNPHSDNFKFADDDSAHAGKVPHDPGAHPAHPHFDNFKYADDDSAHAGKVPHDPPALAANDLGGGTLRPPVQAKLGPSPERRSGNQRHR
jgi:hypothetical protein